MEYSFINRVLQDFLPIAAMHGNTFKNSIRLLLRVLYSFSLCFLCGWFFCTNEALRLLLHSMHMYIQGHVCIHMQDIHMHMQMHVQSL